ncbi:hypothetical protein FHG87_003171 [Trinorchestia longiramus]|nr:hypothetical protein FHG87_003171 [Trinorchestia longiramus]
MNTNSLRRHINEPTRRNNILDLVIATPDLSINGLEQWFPNFFVGTTGLEVADKIGDHQMIDFTLEVDDPDTRTQQKQALDYKRANFELMKEKLENINYKLLMRNKNAEECYMKLKEKIATATEHHILMK